MAHTESASQRAEQVTNLGVYFLWLGNRLGDFLPKQFAEPLAQAMNGGFDAIDRKPKIASQVRVASRFGIVHQTIFESLEAPLFERAAGLGAQLLQNLLHHRLCPAPLVKFLRRGFV